MTRLTSYWVHVKESFKGGERTAKQRRVVEAGMLIIKPPPRRKTDEWADFAVRAYRERCASAVQEGLCGHGKSDVEDRDDGECDGA